MIETLNQKIKKINSCIDKVFMQVNESYKHNEDTFKSVQETLNFILQNCFIPKEEIEEAYLTLGKTGWGKSTTINYLHGNEIIVIDNQRIVVSDSCDVLTPIGDGSGSTTLFPICCQTSFGQVCDLPGDEETRGLCVEMINAISKKNMGMILKSIKLMLVIPYPTFSAAGSYGRGLKDILNSNDKFLCGINKFKNNMIIIITSANRKKNALEEVIKNIHNCLNHPDKELANYEDLLLEVIQKGRIKLFPLPSSETDQGIYSLPYHQQWKNHKRQVIVEQIKKIPSKHCSQEDFSVPENPKIKQHLRKMLIVVVQKIKEQISSSFVSSEISGVELQFYMKFLRLLRNNQKKNLAKYVALFNTNNYLKSPQLKNCTKYIEFITQFLIQGNDQELIQNWCSKQLYEKIQNILNTCQSIFAEKGGNFRKKVENEQLILKPNSKKFNQIQNQFNNLRQLYKKVDQLQLDKENINSQLYQDNLIDVYDKTIQQPYQIDENYTDYQTKQITQKVPQNVTKTREVTKTRTKYRTQKYKQKQAVQKTRKVMKPVKTGQDSRSTWILFIPVNTRYFDKYENVQVDQTYVEYEEKQKTRQVPYSQDYKDTQTYQDVIYIDKPTNVQVPINKTRKKTLYRPKQLFKKQTHRKFIQKKYDQERKSGKKLIQQTHQKILALIDSSEQKQFKDEIKLNEVSAKDQIQNKYFESLKKWCIGEYKAFAYYHQGKSMNIQKLKG